MLFEGLGWFPGEVFDSLLDGENNQMYTIRFTDGEEETWLANYVTVIDEAASIAIVDVGFQFIQIFCGGGHFSGIVIEILCRGNWRCRIFDGEEYMYTLNKIQRLSSLQVIPVHFPHFHYRCFSLDGQE